MIDFRSILIFLILAVGLAPGVVAADPAPSGESSWWASLLGLDPVSLGTLERGPYLQRATPTSIVVRWRTAEASVGRVRYGVAGGPLDELETERTATIEHGIELRDLEPGTAYAYRVESLGGKVLSGDSDPVFRTPPADAASASRTRVWVLGDSGTADRDVRDVRDAFFEWNGGPEVDLWILLGDNAYPNGTDDQYQEALFETFPSLLRTSPVWPTLGNHDGRAASSASQSGAYYDIFTLPTAGEAGGVPSGTEAYYSFDYGGIHFVSLDSEASDRRPGSPMLEWLAEDLAANRAEWTIAFWHHPPYSDGGHDSDDELRPVQMRRHVVPILEAHGVDLVLSGHSHSYERSVLLHGHHGTSDDFDTSVVVDGGDGDPAGDGAYVQSSSAAPGAVYVVTGSAGKLTDGDLDHPAMAVSFEVHGSVVLDIEGQRLDATFLDDEGRVRDRFRLEHTARLEHKADPGDPSFSLRERVAPSLR